MAKVDERFYSNAALFSSCLDHISKTWLMEL